MHDFTRFRLRSEESSSAATHLYDIYEDDSDSLAGSATTATRMDQARLKLTDRLEDSV